jgi:hypothetical protein
MRQSRFAFLFRGNRSHAPILSNAWILIPFAPAKKPPAGLWPHPAPLLEEECDFGGPTLVADFNHPFFGDRPRSGSALPADNGPVNPREIDCTHWT